METITKDTFQEAVTDYAKKFMSVTNPEMGYSGAQLGAMAQAHLELAAVAISGLSNIIKFDSLDEQEEFLEHWVKDFEQKVNFALENVGKLGFKVSGEDAGKMAEIVKEFNEHLNKKYGDTQKSDTK